MATASRSTELKQIIKEKHVYLFGIVETKITMENFNDSRQSFLNEWEITHNLEAYIEEKHYSI